jgi:branched-chain amino acid transport system substrate-binding protein
MRKRHHLLGALALASVLTLTAEPGRADVTIALGIPATGGQIAALGAQARLGAEAAVAAINAKGGIKGEKIVLEIADDQCDPKSAVAAANQLASRGTKFVLGHLCSGASISASNVYNEEGILMITGSATAPDLTERGLKLVFRACGRDDQQGSVAANFIAQRLKPKRVAVIHDKQVYGRGLAEKAEATLKGAGVAPVYTGSITAGERDYGALVARLKQDNIEVVYYGGYHTELGLIARQARQAGLPARFVGADGIASAEFWSLAGDAGAGTLFTFSADPKGRPAAQDAYAQMKKNGEPDNFSFYYYAALTVLADAIAEAGKNPQKVAQVLRSRPFETIVGPMRFDAKGDLTNPEYVVYEWQNGAYTPSKL